MCRLGDYSSRCYQGCLSRSKREASSAQEKVDVIVGPLKLREGDAQSRNTGLDVSVPPSNTVSVAGNVLGPLTAAVAILAIVVFVLAGFLLRPAMKKPLLQRLM